jgi:hypothetical protein
VQTPNCPATVAYTGVSYCSDVVGVPPPLTPYSSPNSSVQFCKDSAGCGRLATFQLNGVTFALQSWTGNRGPSTSVAGWVTEPNGLNYTFIDGPGVTIGQPWLNWTSPDRAVIVDWLTYVVNPNGTTVVDWNVTIGVAIPLLAEDV